MHPLKIPFLFLYHIGQDLFKWGYIGKRIEKVFLGVKISLNFFLEGSLNLAVHIRSLKNAWFLWLHCHDWTCLLGPWLTVACWAAVTDVQCFWLPSISSACLGLQSSQAHQVPVAYRTWECQVFPSQDSFSRCRQVTGALRPHSRLVLWN
jgi:hypothetical protein